jgi:predicted nucleic acid-binding protein
MTAAIVDTGPLVAFFDRAEQHHRWVAERIEFVEPMLDFYQSRLHLKRTRLGG